MTAFLTANNPTGSCIACPPNYGEKSGICSPCAAGCYSCTEDACNYCTAGYKLFGSGYCVQDYSALSVGCIGGSGNTCS